MLQKLVSHNLDIKRLVEKGYAVAFDSNYLLIRDIPYLDSKRQLQTGAIVTKLVFVDDTHVTQDNHQIFFAGSTPYSLDGSIITNLGNRPAQLALSKDSSDVVVERSFSNKPRINGKFKDFFEKIESYVAIISGPAIELHNANPYTYRVVDHVESHSVFKFQDTLTSRAEITDLSAMFKDDVIAIIGAGGTGSYILDFLVKTPVKEIRLFDLDKFHVHNAFRSPGRLEKDELGKTKVEVYGSRYHNFRTGLIVVPKLIDASCTEDLEGVTFCFVCIDKGSSRSEIFDLLISMKIPFIDVGMGLNRKQGPISGMLRTTFYSAEHGKETRDKRFAPETDNPDDIYKTNIQISELNALNASLAIIRYKQIRKFYFEDVSSLQLLFDISDLKIATEPKDHED